MPNLRPFSESLISVPGGRLATAEARVLVGLDKKLSIIVGLFGEQ
jgi:hypothetical protein